MITNEWPNMKYRVFNAISPFAFMNIEILKDGFLLLLEESNKPSNVNIHLLYHMSGDF